VEGREGGIGGINHLKLSSVQNRFRFVKLERELYKRKKEVHEERNMHQNETRKSLKELHGILSDRAVSFQV
jgi:hypothetical protein